LDARFFLVLTLLLAPQLRAQSSDPEPETRADLIESERMQKAANPPPAPEMGGMQKAINRIVRFYNRSPIKLGIEGLGPGAGLTAGTVLEKNNRSNDVGAKLYGAVSVNLFWSAGTGLEFRNLTKRDLTFSINGSYRDAPQLPYYGPGPHSSINDRTNYNLEETLFVARQTWQVNRRLFQSCKLAQMLVNVGPGRSNSFPSTETVFGPEQAPGIDVQSNYVIAGCTGALDYTDLAGDPHKGTYAESSFDRYYAYNHPVFSFYRLDVLAEQYIPFLNKKRVILLRAKTDLSYHASDQVVPFYLQPTLGTPYDLRGFRRYRFYDENSAAVSGEYRWEINTGFDAVLFADFGKVFHKPSQIGFAGMQSSGGFGFRVKDKNHVIARFDVGFSHEGTQIWLTFGSLF